MFVTLVADLVVLFLLISRSGGLSSPAMGVQLLFVLFFALLFPNPIAIFPPLSVLPAVILLGVVEPGGPTLSAEVMRLADLPERWSPLSTPP